MTSESWRQLPWYRPPPSNSGRSSDGGRNGKTSSGSVILPARERICLPLARAAAAWTRERPRRRSWMRCGSACVSVNALACPKGAMALTPLTIVSDLMKGMIMAVMLDVLRMKALVSRLPEAVKAWRPSDVALSSAAMRFSWIWRRVDRRAPLELRRRELQARVGLAL